MYDIANKLGLDLAPYSNGEFNRNQIAEILNGMVSQVDVSIYAKPDISEWQMEALRKCLELGYQVDVNESWIDLRKKYLSRSLMCSKYREKKLWEKRGITIKLNEKDFTLWQLRCIWWGMEVGVNIKPLLNPKLGSAKSVLLLEDLIDGVYNPNTDYSEYHIDVLKVMRKVPFDPNFFSGVKTHPSKADILVEGLESGIDMRGFTSDFDACQMDMILYGLKHGLDVSKYAFRSYDARKMQSIVMAMEKGQDISWVTDNTYWFDTRFKRC